MKTLPQLLLALSTFLCCFAAQAPAQDAAPVTAPAPSATTAPIPSATTAPDSTQPATAAPQAIDPAKAVEIRKLLELTGTVKMVNQMLGQMIASFKTRNTNIPPEFWDRFQKEVNTQDLVDKMIPLYDKYYTLEDLKAVTAFYQSPAGQRMVAANPQIMRESMQIGQDWGRGIGMKIQEEMAKEKAAAPSTPTTPPATPSAPSTQ